MIKGGGTINHQISEAYSGAQGSGGASGKMGGNNMKNGSFYQSKYISNPNNNHGGAGGNMNQSPSPSQTFFKENPPMMMMMDGGASKKGGVMGQMAPAIGANNSSSFAGKKVLPGTYKNPKKLYVSPYSQKMK